MKGDDPLDLQRGFDGWDFNQPVTLEREVQIDSACITDIGLPPSAALRICVLVSTGPAPFGFERSLAYDQTFIAENGFDGRILLELDSNGLSAKLKIETLIVLKGDLEGANPLAATAATSRLLMSDEVAVRLEGDGDQLPMLEVDFPRDQCRAPWRVRIDPGAVDELALPRIRVELNRALPWVREALESEKPQWCRGQLLADIARQVIELALDDAPLLREWHAGHPFGDGEVPRGEETFAGLAMKYLGFAYQGNGIISDALRERHEDRPSFEARFVSVFAEEI